MFEDNVKKKREKNAQKYISSQQTEGQKERRHNFATRDSNIEPDRKYRARQDTEEVGNLQNKTPQLKHRNTRNY